MGHKQLSKEILAFLAKYAKDKADFDPEFEDEEERFNGPDSSMFYAAAKMLQAGRKPCAVLSGWGSGCYKTNVDDKGFEIHQHLLKRVNDLS